MYEPECEPVSICALSESRPHLNSNELIFLQKQMVAAWIVWAAEFAAAATPDQRRTVIDAVVLLETSGLYNGRETTLCELHRLLRQAQTLRVALESMSGEELTAHCRRVCDETIAEEESFSAFLDEMRRQHRPGPKTGAVDRFSKADRALYPEIKALIEQGKASSVWAAAEQLASNDRIAGDNTSDASKAKRLAERYRREENSL